MSWFSPHFLFYPFPGPLSGTSAWLLPTLFLAALAAWAISLAMARRAPDRAGADWWRLAAGWLLAVGTVGLLLTFFAWQRVPYLSMRFLIVLDLLCLVGAGAWQAWRWFKLLPARRAARERRREYRKYLPS